MALTEVCSHVNLFTFRHYTGGHERYARFPLVLSKPSSLVIDSYVGATFPYNWLLRQLYKSFVHHFVLVSYETSCVLYCVSTQKYKKYIYKSCFQPCVKREREREEKGRIPINKMKCSEMFYIYRAKCINYTCLCRCVFVGVVQKSQSQMQTTAKATTATTGQSSKIQEAFGKS